MLSKITFLVVHFRVKLFWELFQNIDTPVCANIMPSLHYSLSIFSSYSCNYSGHDYILRFQIRKNKGS